MDAATLSLLNQAETDYPAWLVPGGPTLVVDFCPVLADFDSISDYLAEVNSAALTGRIAQQEAELKSREGSSDLE